MSMYEKENQDEEILAMLLALNTKINMLLDDMDDLKETVTQIKFFVETMQEGKIEAEEKVNWKREDL